MYGWGSNAYNAIGLGDAIESQPYPIQVPLQFLQDDHQSSGYTKAVQLSCGGEFTILLTSSKKVTQFVSTSLSIFLLFSFSP